MLPGERIAATARALVGTPFRPQGRDPATGLDCIGLALVCLKAAGVDESAPDDYRLSDPGLARITDWGRRAGLDFLTAQASVRAGDLRIVGPALCQTHVMVFTGGGHVHADARLRRVVLLPGGAPWPLLGALRLPVRHGC